MAKLLKFAILFIILIIACAPVFAQERNAITAFEIFIDNDCNINGELQECYCLHWKSGTDKKKIIVNIDGTHKEVTQNPLWYRQTIGGCRSSGEPLIKEIPSKIKSIFGKFAYQSNIFTVNTKSKFIGCSEWYKLLYEASDESTDILYALNLDPNLVTYKIMPCVNNNIADCKRIVFYKRLPLINGKEVTNEIKNLMDEKEQISNHVVHLQEKKRSLEKDTNIFEEQKKNIEKNIEILSGNRNKIEDEISLLAKNHTLLKTNTQNALKKIFQQDEIINRIAESDEAINIRSFISITIACLILFVVSVSVWFMFIAARRNKERSEDLKSQVKNLNIGDRSKRIDNKYQKQITAKVPGEDKAFYQRAASELLTIKGDINNSNQILKEMLNKISESKIENKIKNGIIELAPKISDVIKKRDEYLFKSLHKVSEMQQSINKNITKINTVFEAGKNETDKNLRAVDNNVNNLIKEFESSFGELFWKEIKEISSQSTNSIITDLKSVLEQELKEVQQLGSILDGQKSELLQKIDNIQEGIKKANEKSINEALVKGINEAIGKDKIVREIESTSLYDLAKKSNRNILEIDSLAGSPEIVLAANADIWKKGLESAYSTLNDLNDPKSRFCFFVLELCHFSSVMLMVFERGYMSDIANAAMNKDKDRLLDKWYDYSQRISIRILPAIMYVLDNMLCMIVHEDQRHPVFTIRKYIMQINEIFRFTAEEVGIYLHYIPAQADFFRCKNYMERSPKVSILIHQLIRSETEYLEVFKDWIEGSVFTDEAKEKDLVIDVVSLGYNIAGEKEPAEKTIVTTYYDIKGKF